MYKFLLIILFLGFILYRINRYYLKITRGIREALEMQKRAQSKKRKVGDVSIEYSNRAEKKNKGPQGGEYVDFEEIE